MGRMILAGLVLAVLAGCGSLADNVSGSATLNGGQLSGNATVTTPIGVIQIGNQPSPSPSPSPAGPVPAPSPTLIDFSTWGSPSPTPTPSPTL